MNNFKNIPNLKGKVAIVTGANSGTGYGITFHLAKNNCKVIMASRNESKLKEAKRKLLEEVPNADLEIEIVDLANLDSIKKFSERINSKYDKIDYLANNAGGGPSKYSTTVDGFEAVMAINYLGHFAITTQLLPVLKDGSRIVTFSSIGYKRFMKNDLDVENLLVKSEADFNQMEEYCKGKLCSILFGVKLQSEFERIGSKSMALSCHPGWARTNLVAQSETVFTRIFKFFFNGVSRIFRMSHSLYDGALPAIEALIADDAKVNMVYSPNGKGEGTGDPIPREINHTHYKDEDIDKLWVKSQELVGVDVTTLL